MNDFSLNFLIISFPEHRNAPYIVDSSYFICLLYREHINFMAFRESNTYFIIPTREPDLNFL
ncbi:hypothetical protein CBFG_04700 [Clostridiales bacterium 1_7_47FAA]|nr:hypothetical protein CBFG_04700 [Clostridiales bacterium 1_7_47FAA]